MCAFTRDHIPAHSPGLRVHQRALQSQRCSAAAVPASLASELVYGPLKLYVDAMLPCCCCRWIYIVAVINLRAAVPSRDGL